MPKCPHCNGYPKSSITCNICGKSMKGVGPKNEDGPAPPAALKQVIRKPIAKVSAKQKVKNTESKKMRSQMAAKVKHECSACGDKKNLSHSHLIPVSQRPELRNDPMNQVYHCLFTCHPKWEHDYQGRKNMPDYHENMAKIKEMDQSFYNQIVEKHGY